MAQPSSTLPTNKSVIFGHLGALLCVTMWGLSFVFTSVLQHAEMKPVEVYVNRFVIAYILVLLIKPTKLFSDNWRDEFLLFVCGMLSGSIYFLAENYALLYTTSYNVSLLTSTSPLLTTLIIMVLYKADRPGFGMILGSLVAFAGVVCVVFNSGYTAGESHPLGPLGDALSLAAALCWSFYSLLLKKLNANYDIWFITRKTFFYGVITALPFYFVNAPTYSPLEVLQDWKLLSNVLFLGLGASLIAFVLWAETVKKMGAIKANNYMYLQPVVTLIAALILLGEKVTVIGIIGCVLILGGLWLGDYLTQRKQLKS